MSQNSDASQKAKHGAYRCGYLHGKEGEPQETRMRDNTYYQDYQKGYTQGVSDRRKAN